MTPNLESALVIITIPVVVALSFTALSTERFIIYENEKNEVVSVIEAQHLARYIFSLQAKNDFMVCLKGHAFLNVVEHSKTTGNLIICRKDENLHSVTSNLRGKKQYIVVGGDNGPCGVIADRTVNIEEK